MAVVTQIQVRRGTAAQWTSANPTLASGEFGYETDTGKLKIGDGTTAWTSLGYSTGSIAVGNITGLGTGVATWLATPSSSNLASAVTDETGSGSLVFATSPTLVTPVLGTPSSGTLTNCTGLPVTSGVSGFGTGVATALTTATGSAGAFVVNGGALGTPSSGTLTNATGLPVSGITASTTTALGVGSIELGNATDTTIARVSAGVVSIEGVTVVTTSATQTLTNKTLTTPVISSISNTGTLTLPTSTDTLVGRDTTDTLTNKTLTAPIVNLSLNAQTGTTYTFALTDNGKLVTASNASAQTYTIPTNATAAFATGAQINIIAIGAGQVTIQGTSGVTVASTGATATAPKLRAQYSSGTLIKVATDTWYVIGDLA